MDDLSFVKLFRKIKDWEWYKDTNVKCVFIHILVNVNFKNKSWQGIEIKKGSFITSYGNMSNELGLSVQQVRTALDKLKKTKEITIKTTNKYTVIYLNNYTLYHDSQQSNNNQITINQQSNNNQITTTKNVYNDKNDKNAVDGPSAKQIEMCELYQLDHTGKSKLEVSKLIEDNIESRKNKAPFEDPVYDEEYNSNLDVDDALDLLEGAYGTKKEK